ncbi:MAG: hypothetical protein Q8Q73_14730 [Stagnimonas sp.]|nr:hypothetical protein [Stagnimonas sp.]
MSRSYFGHYWIKGDGRIGARGTRCDRCKKCGLQRRKSNGARVYRLPGDTAYRWADQPARCDPKNLQPKLDL